MERKVNEYLRDFPILQTKMNGRPIVYLDNGATTQKPETVIRAVADYCTYCNANPHRGAYELSVKATDIYERARVRTQQFIGAARPEEAVFTKNATEALNLVAYSYGLANVREGDEIVITISEHHSNIVPWQFVAKSRGAVLKYIYLGEDGNLSEADIAQQITECRSDAGIQRARSRQRCTRCCRPCACGRCGCRCRRLAERAAHQGGCAGDGCGFLCVLGA